MIKKGLLFIFVLMFFNCSKKEKLRPVNRKTKIELENNFDFIKTNKNNPIFKIIKHNLLEYKSLDYRYRAIVNLDNRKIVARGNYYSYIDSLIDFSLKISILNLGNFTLLNSGLIINHKKGEINGIYKMDTLGKIINMDIDIDIIKSIFSCQPFYIKNSTYKISETDSIYIIKTDEKPEFRHIMKFNKYNNKLIYIELLKSKNFSIKANYYNYKKVNISEHFFPSRVKYNIVNSGKSFNTEIFFKSVSINRNKAIKIPKNILNK